MEIKQKNTFKNRIVFLSVAVIAVLMLSGCGCKTNTPSYKVNLEIWGLFDDSDVFAKAVEQYKKRNPRIGEITYKKLTVDSYENDLRDVLATGKGPDIFLIHHTWLAKHLEKLAPAPTVVLSDGKTQMALINPKKVQEFFPDVVYQDFVKDSSVYALPLSVDSLSLYYNKDLFNQAGITRPPKTWEEFDDDDRKLTNVDSFGNIKISGAAMGASSDRAGNPGGGKINRATDILALLMMQSGAEMWKDGQATFADYTANLYGSDKSAGQRALEYYAKFSNYSTQEYSWNSLMHNSIDSFIEGKTAMTLNYSWLTARILDKAPKLNFGIAPVPQNKDKNGNGIDVGFANYWGFGVSKNKILGGAGSKATSTNEQRITEAWKFLVYLAATPSYSSTFIAAPTTKDAAEFDPAAEYAKTQQKPAARRDLIEGQKDDLTLAPFAQGNLIARSWPEPDNLAVEEIFDQMIDDVVLRGGNSREALQNAQSRVNLLIKR